MQPPACPGAGRVRPFGGRVAASERQIKRHTLQQLGTLPVARTRCCSFSPAVDVRCPPTSHASDQRTEPSEQHTVIHLPPHRHKFLSVIEHTRTLPIQIKVSDKRKANGDNFFLDKSCE